jgi:hypothetical protein
MTENGKLKTDKDYRDAFSADRELPEGLCPFSAFRIRPSVFSFPCSAFLHVRHRLRDHRRDHLDVALEKEVRLAAGVLFEHDRVGEYFEAE